MKKDGIFNISAVERESGISKENLRIWERRYGFPKPKRDSGGDRLYSSHEVEQLKVIRMLMDSGLKPSSVVGLSMPKLQILMAERLGGSSKLQSKDHADLLRMIKHSDHFALGDFLRAKQKELGPREFVLDFTRSSLEFLGKSWANGQVSIGEEHQFSELLQQVLRESMPKESRDSAYPKVLLTTASGELHYFGLIMAQVLLTLKGAKIFSYGPQLPVAEIAQAVREKEIDIVALSFSASFPVAKMREFLRDLAAVINDGVTIWVGGAGGQKYQANHKSIQVITSLEDIESQVDFWKSHKNQ